jgi:hypothetical protein
LEVDTFPKPIFPISAAIDPAKRLQKYGGWKRNWFHISQGSSCGHFSPVEEERPKVPHIKQDLALTDFKVHHARINDVLVQALTRSLRLGYAFLLLLSQKRKLIHLGKVVGIYLHLGILQWLRRKSCVKPI